MTRLQTADVHHAVAGRWAAILESLGIAPEFLRNKHMPCPACGGSDRFRFDDKDKGMWYCNSCGAGDGFKLLQNVHGWSFMEAKSAVESAIGLSEEAIPARTARPVELARRPEIATLTARVRDMLRQTTSPENVPECVEYLKARRLWPLPPKCDLRAHVALDCYRSLEGKSFVLEGRFAALVAPVRDVEDEIVTAHVTYVDDGDKADVVSPRKILSRVTGRTGCAVRLMPIDGDTLGIAEGIETALAAWKLHKKAPVWAALNTPLLAKFMPPPEIHRVIIYADADVAGLTAAWVLRDELDGRCTVELEAPKNGDWADVLAEREK